MVVFNKGVAIGSGNFPVFSLLMEDPSLFHFIDHVGDILGARVYFTVFDASLNGSRHVPGAKPNVMDG